MNYENTWLHKNEKLEEELLNGCIIAFNPGNSLLISRQVEAIASELAYDSYIYSNMRTDRKILEAALEAYQQGYEHVFILAETSELSRVERLIQETFDFSSVHAFSEVVETKRPISKLLEAQYNLQPLREAEPVATAPVQPAPQQKPVAPVQAPGTALLLVASLNAWPVRGTGQLIQEVLNLKASAAAYVARYLPKFTTWDKQTVHIRIYVRPPEPTNSINVSDRICMLADGGGWLGLYDANGCGATKVNPPLTEGDLWIPGNHRSGPLTKIKEFTDDLNIGGTIVFAPQSQLAAVQAEFKNAKDIPFVPLQTSVPDDPRPDLIQLALGLANDYSPKAIAARGKPDTPTPNVKLNSGDYFAMQLAKLSLTTGGRGTDENYTREQTRMISKIKGKGYFEGIWAAIPEGDKAFLKEVGEGTGIGDIFVIVNNARKFGKAVLGQSDKDKNKETEKTKQSAEKLKGIEEKLGFGIAEFANDARYKQLKSELDIVI